MKRLVIYQDKVTHVEREGEETYLLFNVGIVPKEDVSFNVKDITFFHDVKFHIEEAGRLDCYEMLFGKVSYVMNMETIKQGKCKLKKG